MAADNPSIDPLTNKKNKFPKLADISVNPDDGIRIADEYDNLKHDPNNPEVKKAYGSFINETNKQFDDLLAGGLTVTANKKGDSPYDGSKAMHEDVTKNKHLSFFPTEEGFGEGDAPKDHPMLAPTKFDVDGKNLLANDVFRIVHDVNGHNRGEPSGFGPKGEHQAYLTHKQLYSEEAGKALFTWKQSCFLFSECCILWVCSITFSKFFREINPIILSCCFSR